ncbi:MAG: hypothetical protein Q9179_001964 [Wetmoreana sp. 5 TL-2023]
MFREPEAVESKAVPKADLTASARSSIRRQRSVRYPPHINRDRHLSSHSRSHAHLERARERERARVSMARFNAEHAYNIEVSANQAHAEASRLRRLESGRAILRDALSYEHPYESMNLRSDHFYALSMMPPPTSSTRLSPNPSRRPQQRPSHTEVRLEGSSSQYHTATDRTSPPAYVPSPPYASGHRSERSTPDALHAAQGAASLTPRFAPAHLLHGSESATEQGQLQDLRSSHDDVTTGDSMDELPPLRRVSRRHNTSRRRRDFPAYNIVDGLGDRWRSVSPDDGSWETLLSTMPPDERLPSTSASSSFRSNEDTVHYERISHSAGDIANLMNTYPHICENTDSDFSETDDDVRTLQRLDGERYSRPAERYADNVPLSSNRRQMENAFASHLTIQRQALRGDRDARRIDAQSGRPSRERL